jgi:stage III sporulation protein SpoIIIAA
MITAIREIVHNGVSVREATHAFEEAKKTKTPVLAKTPVR